MDISLTTFTNINQVCREQTLTGLDTFGPRVIKIGVAGFTTFLKPSATTKTTTALFSFLVDTAHAAYS